MGKSVLLVEDEPHILEALRFLLERGASPNAGDSSGHGFTLDDLAGGPHRSEIIAALEARR